MAQFKWLQPGLKRNTLKHQGHHLLSHPSPIPLWVADLDLLPPEGLLKQLTQAIAREGLSYPSDQNLALQAIINRYKKQGIQLSKKKVIFYGGVMAHFSAFLQANFREGDRVLFFTPCYMGAIQLAQSLNLSVVECKLKIQGCRMDIDLQQFQKTMQLSKPRVIFLTNPHNPCGYIWSLQILNFIVKICKNYDTTLVVDQILRLLAFQECPSALSLFNTYRDILVLDSPSKALNIHQLKTAFGIYNNDLQKKKTQDFLNKLRQKDVHSRLSNLSIAYAFSEQANIYLQQLKAAIQQNYKRFKSDLKLILPKAQLYDLQSSYLVLIDLSLYFKTAKEMMEYLQSRGIIVTNMVRFQVQPRQRRWVRVNIGCSYGMLSGMLERLSALEQICISCC